MLSREELIMMPDIHSAIHRGQFHDIRLLISAGEDVNGRDADNRTPLILCTLIEQETWAVGIARMLLEHGAMVGYKDSLGRNALIHACLQRRPKLVGVFLSAVDYDLNHTDRHGNSALFYAASTGHGEIVEDLVGTLIRYKHKTDLPNKWGMTPLLEACRLGHTASANILIEEGAASEEHRDNIRKWNAQQWTAEYDKNNDKTGLIRCRTYDKPWLKCDADTKAKSSVLTRRQSEADTVSTSRSSSASYVTPVGERNSVSPVRRGSNSDSETLLAPSYKTKLNLVNRSWKIEDRKSKPITTNFYPSPAPFSHDYHLDESRPTTSQPWRFKTKSQRRKSAGRPSLGENEEEWQEEFRQLYRRFEIKVTKSYRKKAKTLPQQPHHRGILVHASRNGTTVHHHNHGHALNGHAGHGHGSHSHGSHGHGSHSHVTHGHASHGHGSHGHVSHGHGAADHRHNQHHSNSIHNHRAVSESHIQRPPFIDNDNQRSVSSSRLLRRPSDVGKKFPIGETKSDVSTAEQSADMSKRSGSEAIAESFIGLKVKQGNKTTVENAASKMLKSLSSRRRPQDAVTESDISSAAVGNKLSPRTENASSTTVNHDKRKILTKTRQQSRRNLLTTATIVEEVTS